MRVRCFWPAGRSGSAIPVKPSPDPVVEAGKLWEGHCKHCAFCLRGLPNCELGHRMYEVYTWLVDHEPRR